MIDIIKFSPITLNEIYLKIEFMTLFPNLDKSFEVLSQTLTITVTSGYFKLQLTSTSEFILEPGLVI